MKDHYKILGVSRGVTVQELKRAFRKLAHLYHPDKPGGDEKKFKEVSESYGILLKEVGSVKNDEVIFRYQKNNVVWTYYGFSKF